MIIINEPHRTLQLANTNNIGSIPTLTLSNSPWENVEIDFLDMSKISKKDKVIESKKDLLALSVARNRLDKECNHFYTLVDEGLVEATTDADQEQANKIRDYYQKKFVFWELKEVQLSSFRAELKKFIFTNGMTYTEAILPLVWRLPEFYEYDVEFEDFRRDYEPTVTSHPDTTRTLSLVKTFVVKNRSGKRKEYWFKDEYENLVYIPVANTNPLFTLMDHAAKSPLKVNATYNKKVRDDKEYYKPYKLKFI